MTPNHPEATGHEAQGSDKHRPPVEETTLRTERIQVERKLFIFTLRENPRGRFLRITEDVSGRRDHIIIPAPGLREFARVVQDMVEDSEGPETEGDEEDLEQEDAGADRDD